MKILRAIRYLIKILRLFQVDILAKGDIVADNYLKPSQVLGVSDGSGKFEKKYQKQKLKIKLIKKKLDLNN